MFCKSPLCRGKEGIESTVRFLVHWPLQLIHWDDMVREVIDIFNNDVTQPHDDNLCDSFPTGNSNFD